MKKLVVIFLLAFFSVANLAPRMQGIQLLKIPTLVNHLEAHYGTDWSWENLKDFVVEHYMNSKLPNDKEHKNLPFKTTVGAPTLIAINCSILNIISDQLIFDEINSPTSMEQVKPIVDITVNIWTPPKQA